jgi:hypothetical protein
MLFWVRAMERITNREMLGPLPEYLTMDSDVILDGVSRRGARSALDMFLQGDGLFDKV